MKELMLKINTRHPLNNAQGFTIVELLIVIVVIGILASITIVAFSGVQQKAGIALLKSDLSSASRQLEVAKVNNNDVYPSTTTAIKKADSTTYQYTYNSGTNYYCLTATSPNVQNDSYYIDSNTLIVQQGLCTGHVLPGAPVTGWKYVSAGSNAATCGIASNDKVYCWGFNYNGRFGNGTSTNSLLPTPTDSSGVLAGKVITGLELGPSSTCAYTSNQVFCWGGGSLGNGVAGSSLVPVATTMSGVLSGKTIQSVALSQNFACSIASDSKEYCWGGSNYKNFMTSTGSPSSSTVPVAWDISSVFGANPIQAVNAYANTKCVVVAGLAYCWGYASYGELGNGTTSMSTSVPQAVVTTGVLSGKTVTKISTGGSNTCAIASGAAYCWGYGRNDDLGDGLDTDSNVPVAVSTAGVLSGKTLTDISTGSNSTCALATDKKVYCWGNQAYGRLGNSYGATSGLPVAVTMPGLLATQLSSGDTHSCMLTTTNQIYCWGLNSSGQLGDGSSADRSAPVLVSLP
ncbi:MAG: prepilin-type N-terminal cleavage/methylation domain-containing protein [Candidatus Saccharimonadales bacterium]